MAIESHGYSSEVKLWDGSKRVDNLVNVKMADLVDVKLSIGNKCGATLHYGVEIEYSPDTFTEVDETTDIYQQATDGSISVKA